MTGILHFETFILAGLLLNITPGNDTVFILSRSMAQGRKAGIVSVFGISTGSLVHTLLAALGLSIIVAKSLLIFNIIKYAGAAYLIYIGFKMLTDRSQLKTESEEIEKQINLARIYRDAVVTNVLNPKVAMFFIAFLPQFIDPAVQNTTIPFMTLGITFTFTGTIWCLILVTFSSIIFTRLRNNKKLATYINKICGTVMIGLGVKVALTGRS